MADAERVYERSRPFLVKHLDLAIALDLPGKAVSGTATLDFERVAPDARELVLDALGFELQSVELKTGATSKPCSFDYDGEALTIRIPQRIERGSVVIAYRAVPRRGMYFLAPDAHVVDRPVQVWTQCQDEDARHWFPCHDKPHVKMTFSLSVTVPSGFVVLSNGEPVATGERRASKNKAVFAFRMDQPLPSYLVTLVVGKFAIIDGPSAKLEDGRQVPVKFYVPSDRVADGQKSFADTTNMIELFSKLTGTPFPWSRYSQVVVSDFIFGGMENTTATTMYEHILLDDRARLDVSSHDLIAHELAHQWFGDYVTCRDWSHAWLNEGFATFFEHVEREHRLGADEYDYGVRGDLQAYLNEASGRYTRPVVCRDYAQPIELFDRHLYEKGGLALHLLRRELGDELFWSGVRAYLKEHAGGIVETNDLQRSLERVSGRSLERFFDQWLYRAGHPAFKVKVSYESGLLSITLRQTQKSSEAPIFHCQLEVDVGLRGGGVKRHQKWITTDQDTLVINLPERPSWVGVDPRQCLIGSLQLEAPGDMLREQLKHGGNARTRWLAAEALARRDDPLTIAALGNSLASDTEAWMVRVEAAASLGKIRGAESLKQLMRQVRTKHPKVRRAIVAAIGEFRSAESAELLLGIAGSDKSYLVCSEAARAAGRSGKAEVMGRLLELLKARSWAEVIRTGALEGLAELKNDAAIPALLEQTEYGQPTRARRGAIVALARLSDERRVRQHLETLLEDADPHLRIDVVRALELIGDTRCRGALRRQLDRETDGRVSRRIREALRDLTDGGAADRRRFSSEIEALQVELAELRTRLSRIEGKASGSRNRALPPETETAQAAPRKRAPRAPADKPSRTRSVRSKLDER